MLLVTRSGRQPARTAHPAKNGSTVGVVVSAARPFPKVVRGGTFGQTQRWGFSLRFPALWPAFSHAPTKTAARAIIAPFSTLRRSPGTDKQLPLNFRQVRDTVVGIASLRRVTRNLGRRG
jgi:hypothetical protein